MAKRIRSPGLPYFLEDSDHPFFLAPINMSKKAVKTDKMIEIP